MWLMHYKSFSYPNPVLFSDLHKFARTRFTDSDKNLGLFFMTNMAPLNAQDGHKISHEEHQFPLRFSEKILMRVIPVLPLPSCEFRLLFTALSQSKLDSI